jgi:hypothetical protein
LPESPIKQATASKGKNSMGLRGVPQKFLDSMDQMLQAICPGSISIHQSRFDSKARHPHKTIYEADRNEFLITRRKDFIREAICGEFDHLPSSGITREEYPVLKFQSVPFPSEILRSMLGDVPRLWVLCSDKGAGVTNVQAIYRGRPMWKVADRDGRDTAVFPNSDTLSNVLAKIDACEGFDAIAWERFVKKYWDACVLNAVVIQANDGSIN